MHVGVPHVRVCTSLCVPPTPMMMANTQADSLKDGAAISESK